MRCTDEEMCVCVVSLVICSVLYNCAHADNVQTLLHCLHGFTFERSKVMYDKEEASVCSLARGHKMCSRFVRVFR